MTGSAQVIRADARALPLPDSSVDLVITSPPYWSLRSYKDDGIHYAEQIGDERTPADFVDALLDATREMVRVTKPRGSIWVNLGDKYNAYNANRGDGTLQRNGIRQSVPSGHGLDVKDVRAKSLLGIPWRYAIRCIDDLQLILRAEVVWSKPNGMPESVSDRVRRSHETWFHFTLSPRHYGDAKAVRDPIPGSVWDVPTQPLRVPAELGVRHHAAFPVEWPKRIISGWSPANGVVLDPFGGTGTVALAALALGRTGISADLSHDYCRVAEWRTSDPAQIAKAQEPIKHASGR